MKYLFLGLLIVSIFSCNTDDQDELDCSNVLCAGRPTIVLEFFDEDNLEQYFLDVTDQVPEGLVITTSSGNVLDFGLDYGIFEGSLSLFQLPDFFTICLENEFESSISSDVLRIDTDDCCDTYEVGEVTASQGLLTPVLDDILFFRLTI